MDVTDLMYSLFQNPWAKFSITLLLFLGAAMVVLHLFNTVFLRLAKKTKTTLDDDIIRIVGKPISDMIAVAGLRIASETLQFGKGVHEFLNNLLDSILILIVAYVVAAVIHAILIYWGHLYAQRSNSKIDTDVLPLAQKASKILIVLMALLMILTRWHIEIGPLLASLGIAGLAISLALKDTLANIFGGVALILDKNFKVGDVIRLETGESGRVMDIGLRSTRIRTWDNEVIILPNGMLSTAKIINYAQPTSIARLVIPFAVEYGNDPTKVKKVILAGAKKNQKVLKEPEPFVRFNRMNDFSLDFKLYVWLASYRERFIIEDEMHTMIFKTLKKNKIKIPFPTRTVYMTHKKK